VDTVMCNSILLEFVELLSLHIFIFPFLVNFSRNRWAKKDCFWIELLLYTFSKNTKLGLPHFTAHNTITKFIISSQNYENMSENLPRYTQIP